MKIQIIVGSTRPGRVSHKVAMWAAHEAETIGDVEIVDLADYKLPLFDEAISPQYNPERAPHGEVKAFLDKLAEADAYIMITPEYNRSVSGVLKNAIDFVDFQLDKKPVAIVAHGSTGGAQAVAHLRGIIPGALGVTTPRAVFLVGRAAELIDDEGNLNEDMKANPYGPQAALKAAVSDLAWYGEALLASRAEFAPTA